MYGETTIILPEIPTPIASFFIHFRDYAAENTIATGTHPGTVTEFLVFFEVSDLPQIECAPRFHDRSRTDLAIWNPGDFSQRMECSWGIALIMCFVAASFIQWKMDEQIFAGDGLFERFR